MTTAKAPNEMTAEEALEAYGFRQDGNVWAKDLNTQVWVKQEGGGFRCLEAPRPGLVIGAEPWGRPSDEFPGLIEVPYTQAGIWKDVSGLHPAIHPECFEWTWPDERVAEIHAYGYTPEYGHRWKRNDEGELVRDRSPLPKAPEAAAE